MEPVQDPQRLRNGTVVSALVAGSGTTLKHFHRQGATVVLEAANPAYQPIELPAEQVEVQGRLVAVWRQVCGSRGVSCDTTTAALKPPRRHGAIAQLVEHLHGMQGVRSSSLLGSILKKVSPELASERSTRAAFLMPIAKYHF